MWPTQSKVTAQKVQVFYEGAAMAGTCFGDGVIKVDPTKVDAIVNMPEPTGKPELFRLLKGSPARFATC
jgi:hypothetical protein